MVRAMKLGFFGDGVWAHRSLERLMAEPSFSIAFVALRASSQDPILRQIAEGPRIPVRVWPKVNAPEAVKEIADFGCELLISMSFDQIIRKQLIEVPQLGFINCHAGRLPFYRGRNILNWALINGEREFGVTVHYIDSTIDTGDIIRQDLVPILSEDDYATVLSKACVQCADTLYAAVCSIRDGSVRQLSQRSIHPTGFYCGQRRDGDEWLDWTWTSARVCNFVKALAKPGPGARTLKGEEAWALWNARFVEHAPHYIGIPGEVVGRNDEGVLIKTGDSFVQVLSMSKLGETPEVPRFPIGTRFGLNLWDEIVRLRQRVAALERELSAKGTDGSA